jgi:hypothetical protein
MQSLRWCITLVSDKVYPGYSQGCEEPGFSINFSALLVCNISSICRLSPHNSSWLPKASEAIAFHISIQEAKLSLSQQSSSKVMKYMLEGVCLL